MTPPTIQPLEPIPTTDTPPRPAKLCPSCKDLLLTSPRITARISQYLEAGGLFNPEMMEHDKVRDLLIDAAETLMHFARLQGHMGNHPGSMDCKICKAVTVVMENHMPEPKNYEKTWDSFWKEICTHKDGSINLDQIKRELHDFHNLINNVSRVYDRITGGKLSKPNYPAATVINVYEEEVTRKIAEAIEDVGHSDCNHSAEGD